LINISKKETPRLDARRGGPNRLALPVHPWSKLLGCSAAA
jgi:hypothetical protein